MKHYERGLHGIGTARKDRKGMLEMPVDRKMKRGDFEYLYSDEVASCKWLDRSLVTMLVSNVEGMAAKSTVPHRQKGSASKIEVPCPDIIKIYNKGMGGIDLIDHRSAADPFDRKPTIRFYLRIVLDLIDVVFANSHIVYNMMHSNDLTLSDFKTIVQPT